MLLNANIPLSPTMPTRQSSWRVGVFFGIFCAGLLLGEMVTEKLYVGLRLPTLDAPSGIALRLTPTNKLWIAKHANGLAIHENCPVDLPSLIFNEKLSWIVLGDTGKDIVISTQGREVSEKDANIALAFGCALPSQTQNFSFTATEKEQVSRHFSFFASDVYAWQNTTTISTKLTAHGISFVVHEKDKENPIPWPSKTNITALPISPLTAIPLSAATQKTIDILARGAQGAFFSWETNDKQQFALTFSGTLSDEEFLSLAYDFGDLPLLVQKSSRDDSSSYLVTKNPLLVIASEGEVRRAEDEHGTVFAYTKQQGDYTVFSTEDVLWTTSAPHWQSFLHQKNNPISYTPRTLTSFGDALFISSGTISIIENESVLH